MYLTTRMGCISSYSGPFVLNFTGMLFRVCSFFGRGPLKKINDAKGTPRVELNIELSCIGLFRLHQNVLAFSIVLIYHGYFGAILDANNKRTGKWAGGIGDRKNTRTHKKSETMAHADTHTPPPPHRNV